MTMRAVGDCGELCDKDAHFEKPTDKAEFHDLRLMVGHYGEDVVFSVINHLQTCEYPKCLAMVRYAIKHISDHEV